MELNKIIPFFDWIRGYSKRDFRSDLIAGITVAIMLIPQGMAYAYLAGMPPIYGLYGGLVPLFFYAILGTSRHLSIGPVAITALLILAGISQIAEPGSAAYIEFVILTGLLIGILQCMLSILQMGFLVNFLSNPVVVGFTSAAAIIIAINQLNDAFGIEMPRFSHTHETLFYLLKNITQTNWIAFGMCAGSIVIMMVLRKISRAIPNALIVVVIGTLLSWGLQLQDVGLAIIKDVPKGLPLFMVPDFKLESIQLVLPTVVTVTIIGIVGSIGIAKVLEAKHQNYAVRPNQELLALGLSKIVGAFFQALPSTGSFTRSAVNSESGAKTGISSIVSMLIVALTLLFLTPLFFFLPKAILAAIILLSVKGLFDWQEAIHLWRTHKRDFGMMLITFVVTLVLGIEEGVLAGVVLSLFMVVYRSSRPHFALLGQLPGTNHYRNISRFTEAEEADDMVIMRFDDQLYFGNASYFKDTIKEIVAMKGKDLNILILDASSIHDIDSTGIHALEEIFFYLQKKEVTLNLCGVIGPVRDMLFKTGLMEKIGKNNQFMYVHDAVQNHQGDTQKNWTENALQTNVSSEKKDPK